MPRTRSRAHQNLPNQSASKTEFDLGFERIRSALGLKSQATLAEMLGICQSSISDASRRGVIPGEWALKLFRARRLNPAWVYEGLPPVFLENQAHGRAAAESGVMPSFLLGYPEGSLAYFQMRDASMEPVIPKNCYVGVDSSRRTMAEDRLYGVDLPLEGRTVRTLRMEAAQDMVSLHAANPAVPVQRMSLADAKSRLVGRVAWVMRCT